LQAAGEFGLFSTRREEVKEKKRETHGYLNKDESNHSSPLLPPCK
jgi:hypothetical protein